MSGKVSTNSVFGTHDWRDKFCQQLAKLSGQTIINLDPTKSNSDLSLDANNPELIFGRNCFMIKLADLVIVNLTDDISVGGSQEMLIAKYYDKPLVGIAPLGGKFHKKEKELFGNTYQNWMEAFVAIPCDKVAEDLAEIAEFINIDMRLAEFKAKTLQVIDESVDNYAKNYYPSDSYLRADTK